MSRVLFATSNGVGLGHLTRSMAIARRLDPAISTTILTLSEAAPVVAREGFEIEYAPSYRRPGSGSDWQWNLRLRRRLEHLVAELEPDLVVFDGVHPYRGLTHVLSRDAGPATIWCRRAMWRPGSAAAALERTGAFDAVLEPGELAAEADRGPTVARRREAHGVGPIVHLDREELLSREDAERELGLEPGGPTALVALGQGGAVDAAVIGAIERLRAEHEARVVVLESSLAPGLEVPDGVRLLRATFPISRLYRGFDLAIAAAGYNAFHEHLTFALPTLFVPIARETDDQAARASWAAGAGLGLAISGPQDPVLGKRVGELLDPERRTAIAERLGALEPPRGASEAARLIEAALAGTLGPPAIPEPGPLARWYRLSSHPVGPSLPIAAALTARDLLAHPERRAARALVVALGTGGGGLESIAVALAGLEAPPERTLVVTDSLDFAGLRRLGVGFERVPSAEELERRGGSVGDYDELIAARFAAILRGRAAREGAVVGVAPTALRGVRGIPPAIDAALGAGS